MGGLRAVSTPLISIALCTYNGAIYLPVQLDSLLAQDWQNLEIVAVDDGSSDGSREILLGYASRDPRISVHFNEQNLGFLRNFEKAFSLTKGEFIAPCDQDDWWHPEKLSGLFQAIGDHSLAYCDSEFMDEAGQNMGRRASDVVRMYQGRDPAAFLFGNSVSGHALLARRSLVERAMPLHLSRYHDWWLAFVAASDEGLVYVDQPWVHYRQHPAAQTDLSGQSIDRSDHSRRLLELDRRRAWLETLAGFPSLHQAFFQSLLDAWDDWSRSWFSPRLVRLMMARRESLFFISRRASKRKLLRALRYVWGLKLRRLVVPWRY